MEAVELWSLDLQYQPDRVEKDFAGAGVAYKQALNNLNSPDLAKKKAMADDKTCHTKEYVNDVAAAAVTFEDLMKEYASKTKAK